MVRIMVTVRVAAMATLRVAVKVRVKVAVMIRVRANPKYNRSLSLNVICAYLLKMKSIKSLRSDHMVCIPSQKCMNRSLARTLIIVKCPHIYHLWMQV